MHPPSHQQVLVDDMALKLIDSEKQLAFVTSQMEKLRKQKNFYDTSGFTHSLTSPSGGKADFEIGDSGFRSSYYEDEHLSQQQIGDNALNHQIKSNIVETLEREGLFDNESKERDSMEDLSQSPSMDPKRSMFS